MADFFDPEDRNNDDQVENLDKGGQDEDLLEIGGKKYSQDELNDLVGLGKMAKEVEERYSTKLDRVYPEYTKGQQKIKELEDQLKEKESQQQKPPSQMSDAEIIQAQQAARQLGILTKEDISDLGLMTKADVESFIKEYRAGEQLLQEADSLEGKYDGKDGRPVFKTQEILTYMQETGIRDPEVAYKVKHEDSLSSWKEKKIQEAKKEGLVTDDSSTAGGKIPDPIKVNRDNLDKLVAEALEGKI